MIRIKAYRTHHTTEVKEWIDVSFSVEWYEPLKKWTLQIQDGAVTGYESMSITNAGIDRTADGWHPCAGTEGRWDKLYIPPREMAKIWDQLPAQFDEVLLTVK